MMDKIYLKRLLFYFCIFHYCNFSMAMQKPSTKPSESTCTIREEIFRTGYVKICNDFSSYSLLKQCTPNNIDECLCSAINQTAYEICKLQLIPAAKFNFDDELTNLQRIVQPNAFCNYTTHLISNQTYRETFQPTEIFPIIDQLNKELLERCPKICFGFDDKPKWLCSALVTVDTLLVEKLHHVKSTTLKPLIADPKINISSPTNGQAETSDQSEPTSRKSKIEDKAHRETEKSLDKDSQLQALKPVNSSDNKSAQQKNDKETQSSPPKDQRAGTNLGIATKDESGTNVLSEPRASESNPKAETNPKQALPISLAVSTTESLQPNNPPESDPEHEDDFDAESDPDLGRPDDVDNRLEKPISNDAEKAVSSKLKEDDIIRPNSPMRNEIIDVQEESHLFVYFMALSLISIIAYIGFHNKHKIFAIVLEGKPSRGGRSRRRPNTAGYRKLDCNLEEAVTSQCNSNVTHVIY